MNLSIEEIIEATDCELIKSVGEIKEISISTDSRNVQPGQIYLPLHGENFNGNNFIEDAINKGAIGYFTDNISMANKDSGYIFLVEDTKTAYLQMARVYKRKINPKTIAITGSSGKTTTKEMLYHVVCECFKTHKSLLNHNNEVGLCQTLTSMPLDTEVLIVEMGMRGLKEIELLSQYSEPDIAIITNAGSAHLGRLGSLENIVKAKCEIALHLNEEGLLIAQNNPMIKEQNCFSGETVYFDLSDKNLKIKELNQNNSIFEYKNQEYKLNIEGEHNIENALSVIEAALKLGMESSDIAKGLEKFKHIEKRWQVENINGYNVINDSYNSNPDSVKAALKTFLILQKSPKVIVLGDMGELGEEEVKYHKEIGEFLDGFEYDYLITVGELTRNIRPKKTNINLSSAKDVAKYINTNVPKGANILLKASRAMKFEDIIEELKNI